MTRRLPFVWMMTAVVLWGSAAGETTLGLAAQGNVYQTRSSEILYGDGVWVSRTKKDVARIHQFLAVKGLSTPQRFAEWLKRNVRPEPDGPQDSWFEPIDTLKRLAGDCEDYAFLSAAALEAMGYPARVLAVRKGRRGHAVCVFKKDGTYHWMDFGNLHGSGEAIFERCVRHLMRYYGAQELYELDGGTLQAVRIA